MAGRPTAEASPTTVHYLGRNSGLRLDWMRVFFGGKLWAVDKKD